MSETNGLVLISRSPRQKAQKADRHPFCNGAWPNPWSTPFEIWCAITRTYEKPFEDTIYTMAGKVIEPKQAAYMKRAYARFNLKTPTDIFGKDYFKKNLRRFLS